MRFCLFYLFLYFFLVNSPFALAIWGNSASCEQLGPNCPPGYEHPHKQQWELASIGCRAEHEALECERYRNPETQFSIRNCSAQSLCEEEDQETWAVISGCFSGSADVVVDFTEAVADALMSAPGAVAGAYTSAKDCLSDTTCRNETGRRALAGLSPVLYWAMYGNPFESEDFEKAKKAAADLYEKGKQYLVDQGVKFECFNLKAKTEMICYGIFSVVAPGAAAKSLTKLPQLATLIRGATRGPSVKLSEVADDGIDRRRRSTGTATPGVASVTRSQFVSSYLRKEFTTPAENSRWMLMAQRTTPDGRTKFFDVENSVMKELNDITNDKDFVTAITNRHKEILTTEMQALESKIPGLELVPYSDFKSVRYAVRMKDGSPLPDDIDAALNRVFVKSNERFANYLKSTRLVRDGDHPEKWFKAGIGETADQANLASRYARSVTGEQARRFTDSDLIENMNTTLKASELYRNETLNVLRGTNLLQRIPGTSTQIPTKEVFEVVRKTDSNEALARTLNTRFGTQVTSEQASKIREYASLVDEFSPGIHVASRRVASLEDSVHGGLNIDFAGMGAFNSEGTARALASSKNIEQALVNARTQERLVTERFLGRVQRVQTDIQDILSKNGVSAEVIQSGDDLVVKPSKPISESVRREIAQRLATYDNPSGVRISSVPAGVTTPSVRAQMGTHGESIEKLLREKLQTQIPQSQLSDVLFMVDLERLPTGSASARLIMGQKKALSAAQQRKIQESFREALQEFNEDISQEGISIRYTPRP